FQAPARSSRAYRARCGAAVPPFLQTPPLCVRRSIAEARAGANWRYVRVHQALASWLLARRAQEVSPITRRGGLALFQCDERLGSATIHRGEQGNEMPRQTNGPRLRKRNDRGGPRDMRW